MKIYHQHTGLLITIFLLVTTDDTHCFEVKTTTKSYGDEISWLIGSCASNNGYGNNQEYTQQCCLPFGTYNLKCTDSYGDGWHGAYIMVDGTKYCESFSSGGAMTIGITIQDVQGKAKDVMLYTL